MKLSCVTRTKNFSKRSGSKLADIILKNYNLVRSQCIYLILRVDLTEVITVDILHTLAWRKACAKC